jgi:hypothetical protein
MSIGAKPAYVKWEVVRGDTSVLRIEFYDRDESNPYDTTGWTFISSVYDRKGKTLTTLDVQPSPGYVTITATPQASAAWGEGFNDRVAQLDFDLQVTIPEDDSPNIVWTPVIGIISVIGDITGRSV